MDGFSHYSGAGRGQYGGAHVHTYIIGPIAFLFHLWHLSPSESTYPVVNKPRRSFEKSAAMAATNKKKLELTDTEKIEFDDIT